MRREVSLKTFPEQAARAGKNDEGPGSPGSFEFDEMQQAARKETRGAGRRLNWGEDSRGKPEVDVEGPGAAAGGAEGAGSGRERGQEEATQAQLGARSKGGRGEVGDSVGSLSLRARSRQSSRCILSSSSSEEEDEEDEGEEERGGGDTSRNVQEREDGERARTVLAGGVMEEGWAAELSPPAHVRVSVLDRDGTGVAHVSMSVSERDMTIASVSSDSNAGSPDASPDVGAVGRRRRTPASRRKGARRGTSPLSHGPVKSKGEVESARPEPSDTASGPPSVVDAVRRVSESSSLADAVRRTLSPTPRQPGSSVTSPRSATSPSDAVAAARAALAERPRSVSPSPGGRMPADSSGSASTGRGWPAHRHRSLPPSRAGRPLRALGSLSGRSAGRDSEGEPEVDSVLTKLSRLVSRGLEAPRTRPCMLRAEGHSGEGSVAGSDAECKQGRSVASPSLEKGAPPRAVGSPVKAVGRDGQRELEARGHSAEKRVAEIGEVVQASLRSTSEELARVAEGIRGAQRGLEEAERRLGVRMREESEAMRAELVAVESKVGARMGMAEERVGGVEKRMTQTEEAWEAVARRLEAVEGKMVQWERPLLAVESLGRDVESARAEAKLGGEKAGRAAGEAAARGAVDGVRVEVGELRESVLTRVGEVGDTLRGVVGRLGRLEEKEQDREEQMERRKGREGSGEQMARLMALVADLAFRWDGMRLDPTGKHKARRKAVLPS